METVHKPVSMLIDEYKKRLADAMNESGLPPWLLVMITKPFVDQLDQVAKMQAEEERQQYEKAVEEGEKAEDGGRQSNQS